MAGLVRGPTMDETGDSICLSFDLEILKFADLGHWQNTEQSVWSKFRRHLPPALRYMV